MEPNQARIQAAQYQHLLSFVFNLLCWLSELDLEVVQHALRSGVISCL